MAVTIEWASQAENQLKDIFDYYVQEAGIRAAKRIIERIMKRVDILLKNPLAGPKEELLADYIQDFRYLVESNYKIVYYIINSHIVIAMVFDCRQNPVKMSIDV